MGQVVDFLHYKKKKEEENTIAIDTWSNILDYERMAHDLQLMIGQIIGQQPYEDSNGDYHYTIYLDPEDDK
jgi:hypothetical protein